METLLEFKQKHNVAGGGKRNFTVTNSWGVRDAFKYIRKNGWFGIPRPLNESEFYHIIRGVNNLLADEIVLGNPVKFPAHMGTLELIKFPKGVTFKDGKLKNTYPINWSDTWKLWYEDREEYQKGTVIRYESPMVYRVKYCKDKADYQNKIYYHFVLNQGIKKRLKKNIIKGKTDTLW